MEGACESEVDVEDAISDYLTGTRPRSFFLYAGAGAGKTWSLVTALKSVRSKRGAEFLANRQRVAVVTFTRAATEEIRSRVGDTSIADISTIHSFAWSLLRGFDDDLRVWLSDHLTVQLQETKEAERKGRAGTKASVERKQKIARYEESLAQLPHVQKFTYSPDQIVPGRGGLSHSQVLQAAASFMRNKPTFREIIVGRYPIVLVDEAQDTNKAIMDCLLDLAERYEKRFVLGLFGDTMQRVYLDGKPNLLESIGGWAQPKKGVNRRSSKRIVQLVNQLRLPVDGLEQRPLEDAQAGTVQLFLTEAPAANRGAIEEEVMRRMAQLSGDGAWSAQEGSVKTLILEHSMAAVRLHFEEFFNAFDSDGETRSAITSRDAIQAGPVAFLGKQILPLWVALKADDSFAVDQIIRASSPLFDQSTSNGLAPMPAGRVAQIRRAVSQLRDVSRGSDPSLGAVLEVVKVNNLLALPDELDDALAPGGTDLKEGDTRQASVSNDSLTDAWRIALHVSLSEFTRYYDYAVGSSRVDTHQGVKGLEFNRVMVVLDDSAAKGNWFSYEKLFSVKQASSTDVEHMRNGEETTIDKTRRLLYVACSRARYSLAVVAYTASPALARSGALADGMFTSDEITVL